MHHFDYFQKMQEERKQVQKANEVFLINQNLKRTITILKNDIDISLFEKDVQELSYSLGSVNLWDVTYRNYMENPNVALAQAILAWRIIHRVDVPQKQMHRNDIERYVRQLGNVDWSLFIAFNERT